MTARVRSRPEVQEFLVFPGDIPAAAVGCLAQKADQGGEFRRRARSRQGDDLQTAWGSAGLGREATILLRAGKGSLDHRVEPVSMYVCFKGGLPAHGVGADFHPGCAHVLIQQAVVVPVFRLVRVAADTDRATAPLEHRVDQIGQGRLPRSGWARDEDGHRPPLRRRTRSPCRKEAAVHHALVYALREALPAPRLPR